MQEGKYKNVYVVDPLGGGTLLSDGTGTNSATNVFARGNFEASDLPKVGNIYKISGNYDGQGNQRFEGPFTCIHSGKTSEFKPK